MTRPVPELINPSGQIVFAALGNSDSFVVKQKLKAKTVVKQKLIVVDRCRLLSH